MSWRLFKRFDVWFGLVYVCSLMALRSHDTWLAIAFAALLWSFVGSLTEAVKRRIWRQPRSSRPGASAVERHLDRMHFGARLDLGFYIVSCVIFSAQLLFTIFAHNIDMTV
jgi:hypothetical protein